MPYGREGEGLHLPPIPEALNRVCPNINYPAQKEDLLPRVAALDSHWPHLLFSRLA
jgi:hypothetical protein